MATASKTAQTTNDDVEWEALNLGLGDEWDFETEGTLDANYLGSTTAEVPDRQNGTRSTYVHQFAPIDEPDVIRFVWGSYSLDSAFIDNDLIRVGDRVRVEYLGKRAIKDGAQQIRRYKVLVAKIK